MRLALVLVALFALTVVAQPAEAVILRDLHTAHVKPVIGTDLLFSRDSSGNVPIQVKAYQVGSPTWLQAALPVTVLVTNGGGNTLSFPVTTSATAPTLITIPGLHLDVGRPFTIKVDMSSTYTDAVSFHNAAKNRAIENGLFTVAEQFDGVDGKPMSG